MADVQQTGDQATCDLCGGVVERAGEYWRHVAGKQRHAILIREGSRRPAETPAPQVCSHVGLGVPPPADPIT